MVLGTVADRRESLRKLSGTDSTSLDNTEADKILERSDNRVEVKTNKFDWTTSDNAFKQVLNASNLYAAAEVLRTFPGDTNRNQANDYENEADKITDEINGNTRKKPVMNSTSGVNNHKVNS